ncbi:hypothetical protein QZH41_003079 [Actinostola sp. cb2023]|nr:hypothetical protein QZH41_003079 [Actinostola sp. cb2023]
MEDSFVPSGVGGTGHLDDHSTKPRAVSLPLPTVYRDGSYIRINVAGNFNCDSRARRRRYSEPAVPWSSESHRGMVPVDCTDKSSHPLSFGAWCSRKRDLHQYLLIDFLNVKNITAISSQGVWLAGKNWVSSYSVSYSCDGRLWLPHMQGGIPKIFDANNDTDSVVRNSLHIPIVARMVRIHPITWKYWGSICIRIEIHGCNSNQRSRGPQGPPGKHGAKGPRGPSGGGVEYIRWGKTACPSGVDSVYRGRIGGEYYHHSGGGANYVCLPEIPKYDKYKPGFQGGAYMYGTEYEVSGYLNPFSKSYLNDHEAPCVACHVKTRSSQLMIPATYECPAGWTREYRGYLMAPHYSHKNSKAFICVDQDAEAVSGTQKSLNGALMYFVEGQCGALPCYPYVAGRELTCVVCTK